MTTGWRPVGSAGSSPSSAGWNGSERWAPRSGRVWCIRDVNSTFSGLGARITLTGSSNHMTGLFSMVVVPLVPHCRVGDRPRTVRYCTIPGAMSSSSSSAPSPTKELTASELLHKSVVRALGGGAAGAAAMAIQVRPRNALPWSRPPIDTRIQVVSLMWLRTTMVGSNPRWHDYRTR